MLGGPTPEQGLADGQEMIEEIKSALCSKPAPEWDAVAGSPATEVFLPETSNDHGGQSS